MTLVIDTSRMLEGANGTRKGTRITELSGAKIKYNKPKAIKLANITGLEYSEVTLLPKSQDFVNDNEMLYRMDFDDIIINESSNTKLFIEKIHVENISTDRKIEFFLPVKPGYKYTSVLRPALCGAYLGPNNTNFREFMCHEVGKKFSDGTPKPVTTYGDMYIWGTKVTTPDNFPPVKYPYEKGNVWKEENNPCPTGFRVPSKVEWDNLLNPKYNQMRWTGIILKIGDRLSFFDKNWFWTSTSKDTERSFEIVLRYGSITKGYFHKRYGRVIRCIRKLPNEE